MNLPCSIVRDLLPLYAEQMTEAETNTLVREHLENCPDCQNRFEQLSEPKGADSDGVTALTALKKDIGKRRWQTAALAALLVFAVLFTVLARESEERYLPFDTELVRVEGVSGGALLLAFDARVNGAHSESVTDEDTGETTVYLMAWTNRRHSANLQGASGGEFRLSPVPDRVIYGFGSEQTLLYGEPMDGGVQILPRLALGYYMLLAAALTAIFGLLWLLFRKKKAAAALRQLFFAPLAYLAGHLMVKGFELRSFVMTRDFGFILIASAAVYGILTLSYLSLRQRKRDRT